MLEDKIKTTLGELLFGNLALQQKTEELQAQLDVANAKLAKVEPPQEEKAPPKSEG